MRLSSLISLAAILAALAMFHQIASAQAPLAQGNHRNPCFITAELDENASVPAPSSPGWSDASADDPAVDPLYDKDPECCYRRPRCGKWLGSLCTCCSNDPCCRTWTVGVGAIFLTRDLNSGTVFVNDQVPAGGNTYVSSDDFGLGTEGGPYVDIIHHGTYCEVQARYWEIDAWSETVGPVTAPNGAVYRFAPPVPFLVGSTVLTSNYTSELHSFELNVGRRFAPNWTGWLGFRTLELDDNLSFNGRVLNAFDTTASLQTENRLYGLQLGLDGALFQHGRFSIEGWGRAGAYVNNRDVRAGFYSPGPSAVSEIEDCTTSFAADAGLFAVYQFTPCLALRVGYQGFWLDGVSTAAGQMSNISPSGGLYGGGPTHFDDSVFAHGASVAIEYYWCGLGGTRSK